MFLPRRAISSLCSRTLKAVFPSVSNNTVYVEKYISCCSPRYMQIRGNRKKSFSSLFKDEKTVTASSEIEEAAPIPEEPVAKEDVLRILTSFIKKKEVQELAASHGLNGHQIRVAYNAFRKVCLENDGLPMELHIIFHDIVKGAGHKDDLFPHFMEHAMKQFPHLNCKEELKKISDLRDPASWYPIARSMNRKIIFHAGPTNSGKTYHSLQRFLEADKSVYCGPLKMLASEVYQKALDKGVECDLVTGEERILSREDGSPADRVSCTVEMTALNNVFDVAVIDEIQMLQDPQRGWAWTRALLGVAAKEVHLCGEAATIPLIKAITATSGETLEVREYKRLTPLSTENKALISLKNVVPGDCIVCFSKKDIFAVKHELESLGIESAVIYGSLPPGTKAAQAKKFNDDNDPCSVMVATDAIGMGLNLNIRRIIFYSVRKLESAAKKGMELISVSQALQIAGRAGRFGTKFSEGYVTTYRPRDLPALKSLLSSLPQPVAKAGLHPTAEQIELFSYHLPESPLLSLLEVFTEMCQMDDSLYFMCNIETFKYLAELLNDLPLHLRSRYIFCCAPVNIKVKYIVAMFSKMARQYSSSRAIPASWLAEEIKWPLSEPKNIIDLVSMEYVHDIFDLYLWLSYRFSEIFMDAEKVREMQKELDGQILKGIKALTPMANYENGSDFNSYPNKRKHKSYDAGSVTVSQMLIDEGTITPRLLEQLKREWSEEMARCNDRDKKGPVET